MPITLLRATGLVTLLLIGGCFYPSDRGKALEVKLQKLEGENEQLRAELLPRVDEKIQQVTRALESLDRASRRSDADASVLLQKTIEDVAALRGELEASQHRISELKAALETAQADLEKKVLQMLGPEAAKQYEARRKLE